MQILHTITKTESGYTLKIWEPAEITKDRIRPFLWEINLYAATVDEFGLVLEQINLLHKSQTNNLEKDSVSSPNLSPIEFIKRYGDTKGSGECLTHCLSTQHLKPSTSAPTAHREAPSH